MSAGIGQERNRERESGRRRERSEGWKKVCVLEDYKMRTQVDGIVDFYKGKNILDDEYKKTYRKYKTKRIYVSDSYRLFFNKHLINIHAASQFNVFISLFI